MDYNDRFKEQQLVDKRAMLLNQLKQIDEELWNLRRMDHAVRFYKKGKSIADIAEIIGVSEVSIRNWLRNKPDSGYATKKVMSEEVREQRLEYVYASVMKHKKSYAEIARELSLSPERVRQLFFKIKRKKDRHAD